MFRTFILIQRYSSIVREISTVDDITISDRDRFVVMELGRRSINGDTASTNRDIAIIYHLATIGGRCEGCRRYISS